MSSDLTELELRILSLVKKDSHRPSAVAKALTARHFPCDQNQVVAALASLEKKGLVERFTSKTWVATSKGQSEAQ
jgi:DNA-binding MarR family transcriptional regulator